MEDIIEFILELILEGTIEIGSNKKVPKIIRYPLIALSILITIIIILGIFLLGIFILKDNIYVGLFLIIISIIFLVSVIINLRKTYLNKTKQPKDTNLS